MAGVANTSRNFCRAMSQAEEAVEDCNESSVATYLGNSMLQACGTASGYNFSSGVHPTYAEAAAMCDESTCETLFTLAMASTGVHECTLPYGDHIRLLADLVYYEARVCNGSIADSSSGSSGDIVLPGSSSSSSSSDEASSSISGSLGSGEGSTGSSTLGIVLGVVAGVIVVLGVLLFCCWRRRKAKAQSTSDDLQVAILSNVPDNGSHRRTAHTGTATGSTASGSVTKSWKTARLADLKPWRVDVESIRDLERVGHGAHGVVWRVLYRETTVLASKRIQTDQITPERTQDFVEEIKLVSQLQHPSIVDFVGVAWTMAADLQVLFEFMDKGDLRSHLLDPSTPRAWSAEKISIAHDIVQALVYVHSFRPPLVHRDLKSQNVLLSSDLHAKLTDFGVSRFQSESNTMTIGVGTSRWLAPEVILGQSNYGPEADIFSFGVVLSELDTHELPYDDARTASGEALPNVAMLQRVAMGLLKPTFRPTCPPDVLALALRCMEQDSAARPSAPQVAYELRNILKQWTSPANSPTASQ